MPANPFMKPAALPATTAAAASATPSPIAEVSFDDADIAVALPSRFATLSDLHRAQLKAWVERTQLDEFQRAVVEAPVEGVHRVLANAGAGKTHTLIARAIKIIATTDIAPSEIALLTFSNRAAKEIKERFRAIMHEVTGKEGLPIPYIGTLHGFAYQLVVANEGYKQSILGEGAGKSLLRRLIKTELYPNDKSKSEPGTIAAIYEAYQALVSNNELHLFAWPVWNGKEISIFSTRDPRWTPELRRGYKYVDQLGRTATMAVTGTPKGFNPPDMPNIDEDLRRSVRKHYATMAKVSEAEFTNIVKSFLAAKYATRTFEFSDLLYYPLAYLSQHPSALRTAWQRTKIIFQDEAQDQDSLQYALLRLVAGEKPNLLFCADTKQTLYFWRNARPDLTDALDKAVAPQLLLPGDIPSPGVPVHSHYLKTNYRSKAIIVELANLFAEGFTTKANEPSLAFHDNGKSPVAVRGYHSRVEENNATADAIVESVRKDGRKFSDHTIIARKNRQLIDLEASLIAKRIPYHLKHDKKATTKQSTFRVIAAYYAIALNPRDVHAFCEVLEQVKGLGDKTIQKLQVRFNDLFQKNPQLTLERFSVEEHLPDVNGSMAQYKQMAALLDLFLKPFIKMARSGQYTLPQLSEELQSLYRQYGSFEDEPFIQESSKIFQWPFLDGTLTKVCRTLEQIYMSLQEDPDFASQTEPQKIAALHSILQLGEDDSSAEDLEEDFVPGKAKKDRVTLTTGHAYKGKQAPIVFVVNQQDYRPIIDDPDEEERCWFYVAITRAQERLIVTYSHTAQSYANRDINLQTNMYLEEYQQCCLELKKRKMAAKAV